MLTKGDLRGLARGMADCTMEREGLLTDSWSYDYGVVWRGMEMLHGITGEQKYYDYIRLAIDTFVDDDGHIRGYLQDEYNLDHVCNGRQLLYLFRKTQEGKYRKAADTLYAQLRMQPRTGDGGFWHKKIYPDQMWLDGLHMAAPFYLEYALLTGQDDDTVNDVVRQLLLADTHTHDARTGLNRHAWDGSRAMDWADPLTGQSPHAWGRAMGWYMVALADVLELLPAGHPSHPELQALFERMARVLLSIRYDGVWLQVPDCPDRPENYPESSASCMIVYALLKGARLCHLPEDIGQMAQQSYRKAVSRFVGRLKDGRLFLSKCCRRAGLGGMPYRDGSFDYYMSEPVISFDLKGTGAFIQAACEMERLP